MLIRRLAFDLTGLPPTPDEVEAFVADPSNDAYERLVDRLLASPHYGERWGRHWLDLARYADSDGYESDRDRKIAYRYRDFVIRALNADMPFDQFVRWQIAGDEYAPDDPAAVAATGFCTAAPSQDTTPADTDENKAKIRYDELDNMLATTGSGLLGLTIGCARCHDHKFDPIPTRDYYRMLAAFTTAERREAPLSQAASRPRSLAGGTAPAAIAKTQMSKLGLTEEEKFWLRQPEHFFVPVQIELYKKYGKLLDPSPEQLRAGWMREPQRDAWKQLEARGCRGGGGRRRSEGHRAGPARPRRRAGGRPTSWAAAASRTGRIVSPSASSRCLTRGTFARGVPGQGDGLGCPSQERGESLTRDRRARHDLPARGDGRVADRLDHGAGGLLARVVVNRLWQHHFGEGLVRTPDDFGTTGDPPDHPELLDWLAGELIRGGWRLKPIHRLIVTSTAYRQGTWRRPRRRGRRTPRIACSGIADRSGSRPRRSATRCSPSAAG